MAHVDLEEVPDRGYLGACCGCKREDFLCDSSPNFLTPRSFAGFQVSPRKLRFGHPYTPSAKINDRVVSGPILAQQDQKIPPVSADNKKLIRRQVQRL
jgi:hypothetical protein